MLRTVACAFFVLLFAGPTHGEWQIAAAEHQAGRDKSIVHWRTALTDLETTGHATLDCVTFSNAAATLAVIDQPQAPRRKLAEIMSQHDTAAAGVNGGYFDPENAPVGLLVSNGKITAPLRKAKLLTGVLFDAGDRIDIVRASRFTMNKKIRSALQCGPVLVERGSPVVGLNDSRQARRTFAAVDGDGRVALGVCSAVSLAQMSRILVVPTALGRMKVTRALNLDGGSSTAFWFAGEKGTVSLRELKTVRDFVAVIPKPDR